MTPSSCPDAPAASAARTILIVDDDRSVTETFARMLSLEGFSVRAAINPESGLQMAEDARPDAVILDLRMPILNGLQFLRRMRRKPDLSDVPVAIVTGDYFIDDEVALELRALGASLRFKPLWLDDLVTLARTLVTT